MSNIPQYEMSDIHLLLSDALEEYVLALSEKEIAVLTLAEYKDRIDRLLRDIRLRAMKGDVGEQ